MKKIHRTLSLLILGMAVSFALRAALPSRAGLTWTSVGGTYFIGLNLICFWGMLMMTVALSTFLYLRKGEQNDHGRALSRLEGGGEGR